MRRWLLWLLLALLLPLTLFLWSWFGPDPQRAAGAMTVMNRSSAAFEQPAGGLTPAERRRHGDADLLFDRTHVPRSGDGGDGLGPQFIANSCNACHVRNGRGRATPEEALVRIALRQPDGLDRVPGLGHQVQDKAVLGAEPEASVRISWRPALQAGSAPLRRPDVELQAPGQSLDSAAVARSLRLAPPLVGIGLLEAVPEATLTALADPEDANHDGISGRIHWLDDPEGGRRPGRFGWKAITASVRQQAVAAYLNDMGLTTPVSTASDRATDGRSADVGNPELDLVTYYSQTLGAPRTGRPAASGVVREGQRLMAELACAGCHVPQLRTGSSAAAAALNGQSIWPYTDLLLHDMGPDLDDGVAELGAASSEWRTAPLWGIGLTRRINPQATYLHDGRARSLEEAILWHGGEASGSRDRYMALAPRQRQALLRWLGQL
jgi:CxxC motif-containing protein (DUF1111 family)